MGIGDIIITVMLVFVLAAALHTALKRRRKGGCGCGCEGCRMNCGKRTGEKHPRG